MKNQREEALQFQLSGKWSAAATQWSGILSPTATPSVEDLINASVSFLNAGKPAHALKLCWQITKGDPVPVWGSALAIGLVSAARLAKQDPKADVPLQAARHFAVMLERWMERTHDQPTLPLQVRAEMVIESPDLEPLLSALTYLRGAGGHGAVERGSIEAVLMRYRAAQKARS